MSATRMDYRWLKWRAGAHLVIGMRGAAEAIFDDMVARWPDEAYVLASRSHLRAEDGRRGDAIADLERAVALPGPANGTYWFNLAFMLEQEGRDDAAEHAFRRASEISPKLDRAWYGLALLLIRQQRLDEAVEALKKNTTLQPMSPHGWYQLARVHIDRYEPDEALKVIRHLQGFEPKVAAQLERETGLKINTG